MDASINYKDDYLEKLNKIPCAFVWTGGFTTKLTSPNAVDWRWLYIKDVNGQWAPEYNEE